VTRLSVKKVAEANFPTHWGQFRIYGFEGVSAATIARVSPNDGDPATHEEKMGLTEGAVALVMGDIHSTPPLVRIHSQCLTGDVFASMRCDYTETPE